MTEPIEHLARMLAFAEGEQLGPEDVAAYRWMAQCVAEKLKFGDPLERVMGLPTSGAKRIGSIGRDFFLVRASQAMGAPGPLK